MTDPDDARSIADLCKPLSARVPPTSRVKYRGGAPTPAQAAAYQRSVEREAHLRAERALNRRRGG